MAAHAATARLRHTFHYPSESASSSDEADSVMDEQEQENYISTLTAQNAHRNSQFRLLLVVITAISAIPSLSGIFHRDTLLVSILGLSSLAATGYLLYALPVTRTGLPMLDRDGNTAGGWRQHKMSALLPDRESPLMKYLPYLNVALAIVVAVAGLLHLRTHENKRGVLGSLAGQGNLPLIVNVVVLVAKVTMAGVDPERELSGLMYEYKGA